MSTLKVSLMGLSSRIAATGLTIAFTLILARRLGPEGIGKYFLFVRVAALLAVVAELGLTQGTIVFAGRGESSRQIHNLVIRVSICSSIVLLFVFAAVMKLFGSVVLPNYPPELLIGTTIALPFILYSSLWRYLMVGLAQVGKANLVQLGSAAATFLLVIIFVLGLSMAHGTIGAALAVSGAQIIGTVIVATLYLRTTRSRFVELVKIDRSDRNLLLRQVRMLLGRSED